MLYLPKNIAQNLFSPVIKYPVRTHEIMTLYGNKPYFTAFSTRQKARFLAPIGLFSIHNRLFFAQKSTPLAAKIPSAGRWPRAGVGSPLSAFRFDPAFNRAVLRASASARSSRHLRVPRAHRGENSLPAHDRTGVGREQVHAHVMARERQILVHHLPRVPHADLAAIGAARRENAVVVPFSVAEPEPLRIEAEARHDAEAFAPRGKGTASRRHGSFLLERVRNLPSVSSSRISLIC